MSVERCLIVSFLRGADISLGNDCSEANGDCGTRHATSHFSACYLCLDLTVGDFVMLAFSASSKSFVVSFGSSSSTT